MAACVELPDRFPTKQGLKLSIKLLAFSQAKLPDRFPTKQGLKQIIVEQRGLRV